MELNFQVAERIRSFSSMIIIWALVNNGAIAQDREIIYENNYLKWEMLIPNDWDFYNDGRAMIFSSDSQLQIKDTTNLLSRQIGKARIFQFRKNSKNSFNASLERLSRVDRLDVTETTENLIRVMKQSFDLKRIDAEITSSKISVSGVEFEIIEILTRKRKDKVKSVQLIYIAPIDKDFVLTISIRATNRKNKAIMLEAFKSSEIFVR